VLVTAREPFKHATPRYAAYCIAHGATSPADQLAKDMARYGAHHTRPYVYWIGGQADVWCKEHQTIRAAMGFAEQQQFTEWLVARYAVPSTAQTIRQRAIA
jgi:hypothetical protein